MRRALPVLVLVLSVIAGTAGCATAQARVPGTLVLGTPGDASLPIPPIGTRLTQNANLADQLFLRLGHLTASLQTSGDKALTPVLARSWTRIDSVTLVFEIDPRARWQDGQPVTAKDAVFTWEIARDPRVSALATTFAPVLSVEATGPRTFRVRFRHPFSEQLFLFGFNFQPLPSHLLQGVPADSIGASAFAQHPIGDGPYRWIRRVPGQQVELAADTTFFLGRPGIARVIFRSVSDAVARLNLLLSGDIDVLEGLLPNDVAQVAGHPALRIARFPWNGVTYALFNERNPADTAQPNAILTDLRVRQALVLALDRRTMATAVFGTGTDVPDAAESQLWSWVTGGSLGGTTRDTARARALLAAAGWRDSDGDGILDRNGAPLRLSMIYPEPSAPRVALALQAQAMWKTLGIDVQLQPLPGQVWVNRRNAGQFDIDMVTVNQDASPSSLTESWSCATAEQTGSSNVGHWCDREFDADIVAALRLNAPATAWRAPLLRMASQYPAAFLAAPANTVALHTRYENVTILPIKQWLDLWRWRVRPSAALARDR